MRVLVFPQQNASVPKNGHVHVAGYPDVAFDCYPTVPLATNNFPDYLEFPK
jgi:hypothetical protein